MRQMSVISGHSIFTGFYRLTGCQRDPRDRGVTSTTSVIEKGLESSMLCLLRRPITYFC